MTEPTPWTAWLRVAVALGLGPDAFWRLSLREWRALISPISGAVLTRGQFDALAHQFPDQEEKLDG